MQIKVKYIRKTMILLTLLSNVSLSLALVVNHATLSPRWAPPTMLGMTTATAPLFPPSSSLVGASYHSRSSSRLASPAPSRFFSNVRKYHFPVPLAASYDRNGKSTALSAAATSSPSTPTASSFIGTKRTILATTLLLLLDSQFRSLFVKNLFPSHPHWQDAALYSPP